MIIGVKLNSLEPTKELFDILEDNSISEVHFFYDDYIYKDCLFFLLKNKQSDKKYFIHINNIKDITHEDLYVYNTYEVIVVIPYEETTFNDKKYNYYIIPYIDRLIIDFQNQYKDIFDIRTNYKKASKFYHLRNYYFCNVLFDINNVINVDEYIDLYKMLYNTGMISNIFGKSFLEKTYLNLLDSFKIINENDETNFIIPYNVFYYDISDGLLYYNNLSFKYEFNLKEIYSSLFVKNNECITCHGNAFCPKYNVNCEVCKKFYSFFVEYVLDMSERAKIS